MQNHQNGDTVIILDQRLDKIGNTQSYCKTLLKVEGFLPLSYEEDATYTRHKVNYSEYHVPLIKFKHNRYKARKFLNNSL
jgi:hypothetical protein